MRYAPSTCASSALDTPRARAEPCRRAARSGEDAARKLCSHVVDVDAERAALVACGVTTHDTHRFESVAFCDGVDPEGNIFPIATRR